MTIEAKYFYEIKTSEDLLTIVVKNNYGQREFSQSYQNKTSVTQELEALKNRMNTNGVYSGGLFYPKTGELVMEVTDKPVRKKILVGDEYLRS
jgi:hypothetical protein